MMVALFLKKKTASSGGTVSLPNHVGNRQRPSQLSQAVSPFEECVPSADSFSFKKGFAIIRRKHSTQRDQLAKLKAKETLKATMLEELNDVRDEPAPTGARDTGVPNKADQKKNWTSPLSMDMFAPNVTSCSALPPIIAPERVPLIISITNLDEDDDANSEISLEEVLHYMSSLSGSTEAAPSADTDQSQAQTWAPDDGWSYPNAVASITKSCLPSTLSDLGSTDSSSISWPSDEDDEEESSAEELLALLDGALVDPQLLIGKQQWACAYDDGSEYFKSELACGGFKFWSEGEIHQRNLREPYGLTKAARDEEDDRGVDEKEGGTRI